MERLFMNYRKEQKKNVGLSSCELRIYNKNNNKNVKKKATMANGNISKC